MQLNPKIGPAIRHLGLDGWSCDQSPEDSNIYEPALFKNVVQQASHSPEEAEEWEKDLREGNEDAWLGLIILSLRNVRELNASPPRSTKYFRRMLSRAALCEKPFDSCPGSLQRLEDVLIYSAELKDYTVYFESLPFFHFPEMRKISLESVVEDHWSDPDNHPAQRPAMGTSPIEEIKASRDCNGSNGFSDFITSCANLKRFEYQHSNLAVWGQSYIDFRAPALYKPLLTQKHSLEVLHLNDKGEYIPSGFNDGLKLHHSCLGSLAAFNNLKELRIRLRNLLDFDSSVSLSLKDSLPSSLESLTLANCRDKYFPVVIENLQEMLFQIRFPCLKKVEIQPFFVTLAEPSAIQTMPFPPSKGLAQPKEIPPSTYECKSGL
ncbi:hypothetical protein UA08_06892 [Talaromyces atroroseus]|uniref:Leucine-rich repeat domain-containing protein n=1 Tax=Talaromyces atroroseus TaxID=1441469 RepID=A0A225AH66_TALAT|nr:hypothetical protein UA08_06892 [Talaromyces atroroseus]OKL57494.1 hypothetical protein UA08_06892 [Talaromyces atroroseus]